MLNILKQKQNVFYNTTINYEKQNNKLKNEIINNKAKDNLENEYRNIVYYPSSGKEWFSNVYAYNKSYMKSLVNLNVLVNNILENYFNMLENRIKLPLKRRRPNKARYSANKIYFSRAELNHTNNKLTIILYAYNKQKSYTYFQIQNNKEIQSRLDYTLVPIETEHIWHSPKIYSINQNKSI